MPPRPHQEPHHTPVLDCKSAPNRTGMGMEIYGLRVGGGVVWEHEYFSGMLIIGVMEDTSTINERSLF